MMEHTVSNSTTEGIHTHKKGAIIDFAEWKRLGDTGLARLGARHPNFRIAGAQTGGGGGGSVLLAKPSGWIGLDVWASCAETVDTARMTFLCYQVLVVYLHPSLCLASTIYSDLQVPGSSKVGVLCDTVSEPLDCIGFAMLQAGDPCEKV